MRAKYCNETKLIIEQVQKYFKLDIEEKAELMKRIEEILRGKQNEKPKLRNFPTKI